MCWFRTNHLDVESVEALATALEQYQGTVLFTSHDRHFMHRVATAVIEVSGGRVASYPSSYDDYVYRVQKELQEGLRAEHATYSAGGESMPTTRKKIDGRKERQLQKQLRSIERRIQKQDEQKQLQHQKLLEVTSNEEANQIRRQIAELETSTGMLEEEWIAISTLMEEE
jgi:ATP-binding cassette, subfamily F, member 3